MELKEMQVKILKDIRHCVNTYDGTNFYKIIDNVSNIVLSLQEEKVNSELVDKLKTAGDKLIKSLDDIKEVQ